MDALPKDRETPIVSFIRDLMRRRHLLPSHLAARLGVSHPTVGRWLAGDDTPSVSSCRKIAEFAGVPAEKVLALAGYLPEVATSPVSQWPEFREYATLKYPDELDDDVIAMIEDLIERRREKRRARRASRMGSPTLVLPDDGQRQALLSD